MKTDSTQNQPSNAFGGIPCPRCKSPIRFPIQALLMLPSFTCSQCGLELQIDPRRSAAALQELRKYVASLDEAQNVLDDGKLG